MNTRRIRIAFAGLACLAVAACDLPKKEEPGPAVDDPVVEKPAIVANGNAASWETKKIDADRRSVKTATHGVIRLVDRVKEAPSTGGVDSEIVRVESLQRSVDEALDSAYGLLEHLRSVRRELQHSPIFYSAQAASFRQRAQDYTDQRFRDDCLSWSRRFEELVAASPQQIAVTDDLMGQVEPTIGFIRETKNLLTDYHLFLSTAVDHGRTAGDASSYLSRLRGYADKFSRFEEAAGAFERWPGGEPPGQPQPQQQPQPAEEEPKASPAVRTASFSVERKPSRRDDIELPEDAVRRKTAEVVARPGELWSPFPLREAQPAGRPPAKTASEHQAALDRLMSDPNLTYEVAYRTATLALARQLQGMVATDPIMKESTRSSWSTWLVEMERVLIESHGAAERQLFPKFKEMLVWFEATEPDRAAALKRREESPSVASPVYRQAVSSPTFQYYQTAVSPTYTYQTAETGAPRWPGNLASSKSPN